MSTSLPETTTDQLPAVPDDQQYSQATVDKQMRRAIVEVSQMPLQQLTDLNENEIHDMPAFKAMWVRIMSAATRIKPDMRAAEFIQEHLAGKAIQRIEQHTTTVTYQDLLNKVKRDEGKYQDIVTVTATPVDDEHNWDTLK